MNGAALEGLVAALGLHDASQSVVGAVADVCEAFGVAFNRELFEAQVDDWRARAVVITAETIAEVAAERRS